MKGIFKSVRFLFVSSWGLAIGAIARICGSRARGSGLYGLGFFGSHSRITFYGEISSIPAVVAAGVRCIGGPLCFGLDLMHLYLFTVLCTHFIFELDNYWR